jgi:hypothetical protein
MYQIAIILGLYEMLVVEACKMEVLKQLIIRFTKSSVITSSVSEKGGYMFK